MSLIESEPIIPGLSVVRLDPTRILIEASFQGDVDRVQFLLDRGIDPGNALVAAAMNGKTEVVAVLLGSRVSESLLDQALIQSSTAGHTPVVRQLLLAGANPEARSNYPIVFASYGGYTEIVKMLLEAGADVSAHENTPISLAVKGRHLKTAEQLLKAGADPRAGLQEERFTRNSAMRRLLRRYQSFHAPAA